MNSIQSWRMCINCVMYVHKKTLRMMFGIFTRIPMQGYIFCCNPNKYQHFATYYKRINGIATHTPWWRHQMETVSALLTICAGYSPGTSEFPAQRPVARGFDVFFDLRPNKRLSKQSWGWWFETPSRPLWRHRNASQFLTKGKAQSKPRVN